MKKLKEFFKICSFIRELGTTKTLERIERFNYDSLTGIQSRGVLKEKEEKRKGDFSGFSVVFVDVDNLKVINDKYGYDEGNKAIKSLAEILVNCSRAEDAIRLGGDEFLVLPETNERGAEKLMKRAKSQKPPYELKMPLRFSYGIAECNKSKNLSVSIREAEEKMREMKKNKNGLLLR